MEKTLLLTISYDGRPFSGWQRQPSRRTVQGELEEALSEILRRPVKVDGCSRTDAGVHALGQCASFSGEIKIPTENLAYALNNRLPGSIRIVGCEEKPAGFHARFNSRGKTYLYRITTGPMKDPFQRDHVYHVTRPLDTERMRVAAGLIEGKHDFACFQAAGGQPRQTTVRTIYRLEVEERPWAPFSDMGLIGSAPAAGEAGRGSAGGESCGETAFFTIWYASSQEPWWMSARESWHRRTYRRFWQAATERAQGILRRQGDCIWPESTTEILLRAKCKRGAVMPETQWQEAACCMH